MKTERAISIESTLHELIIRRQGELSCFSSQPAWRFRPSRFRCESAFVFRSRNRLRKSRKPSAVLFVARNGRRVASSVQQTRNIHRTGTASCRSQNHRRTAYTELPLSASTQVPNPHDRGMAFRSFRTVRSLHASCHRDCAHCSSAAGSINPAARQGLHPSCNTKRCFRGDCRPTNFRARYQGSIAPRSAKHLQGALQFRKPGGPGQRKTHSCSRFPFASEHNVHRCSSRLLQTTAPLCTAPYCSPQELTKLA